MSRSTDPNHFFQTSDSIAANERRAAKSKNTAGNPLDIRCKILAVLAAEGGQSVFVAGADGQARKIDLDSHKVRRTFSGPTAPLTSLALTHSAPEDAILFAGCWDKSIHSWSVGTGKALRRYAGHSDFVKCLLTARIGDRNLLISGGADANIIIWDISTGRKLHTLKGHSRAVLDLAIDPASVSTNEATLFSADTVRDVRRWTIGPDSAAALSSDPLVAHETSVNRLRFEPVVSTEQDQPEGDLWTASSDKTAMRLVRDRDWQPDTVLDHPDFVRDVVTAGRDGQVDWVVTACRDEEVRVWDPTSGKLQCIYSGHFEEVTGLAVVDNGRKLVSVSLDGTLRQWSLDAKDMQSAMASRDKVVEEPETTDTEQKEGLMTAEEEAELAELMDSD